MAYQSINIFTNTFIKKNQIFKSITYEHNYCCYLCNLILFSFLKCLFIVAIGYRNIFFNIYFELAFYIDSKQPK